MAETIVEESESMVLRMENGGASLKDDVSSISSMRTPLHPMPQLQGPFDESMLESLDEAPGNRSDKMDAMARRSLLLQSEQYERIVAGRWRQRPGEKYHPLWKLTAQLSFGMHLLAQSLAKSEEDVMRILQSHVDDIDSFLEGTSEDFDLAQADIQERLRYLKLPLEHAETFERMLQDRSFRSSIIEGNEKIEHIIDRTSQAMKDSLKDVQKGVDATNALTRYLQTLQPDWQSKSAEVEAVYHAMVGNVTGWQKALGGLQWKGKRLGVALVQLSGVIIEMAKRVAAISKASLGSSPQTSRPQSRVTSPHSSPVMLTPNGTKTSSSIDKPLPIEPETPKPVRQITIVKRQKSRDYGTETIGSADLAPPKPTDAETPSTPRTKLTKRKSASSISRSRSRPSLDRDRKTSKGASPSPMIDVKMPVKKRVSSPDLSSPRSVNETVGIKKRVSSPNLGSGQRFDSSSPAQIPKSPDPRKLSLSQRTKSLTKRISSVDFSRKRQVVNNRNSTVSGPRSNQNPLKAQTTSDSMHDDYRSNREPHPDTPAKQGNRKTLGDRTRSLTRRIARVDVLTRKKSIPDTYTEANEAVPPIPNVTTSQEGQKLTDIEVHNDESRASERSTKSAAQRNLSLTNRISRGNLLDLRKREVENTIGLSNEGARLGAPTANQIPEEQRNPQQGADVQEEKVTQVSIRERNQMIKDLQSATQDQAMVKPASNMVTKSHDVEMSLENLLLQDPRRNNSAQDVSEAVEDFVSRPTSSRRYSLTSKIRRPSLDGESLRPTSSRSLKLFPGKIGPRNFSFNRKDRSVPKNGPPHNVERSMSMPSTLQPIDVQAPRLPSPDVAILNGQSLHDFIGYDTKGTSKPDQSSDKNNTHPALSSAPDPAVVPPPSPRSPYSLFPPTKDRPKSPRLDSRPSTAVPSVRSIPERNPTFTSHPPTLPLATPMSIQMQETPQPASSSPIDNAKESKNSKPEFVESEKAQTSVACSPQLANLLNEKLKEASATESDVSDSGLGSSPTEIEGYISSPNTDVFYTPLGSLPTSATLPSEDPSYFGGTKPDSEEADTDLVTRLIAAAELENRKHRTNGNDTISEAAEDTNPSAVRDIDLRRESTTTTTDAPNPARDLSAEQVSPESVTSIENRVSAGSDQEFGKLLQLEGLVKEDKQGSASDVHPPRQSTRQLSSSSPGIASTTKRFSVPLPHQITDSDWMNFIPVSGDELSPTSPVSPTHLADVAIPRPRPRMGDRSLRRSFPSYKRLSDSGLGRLNPVKEEVDQNLIPEGRESIDWRTHSLKNRSKRMSQVKRRPVSELYLRNRGLDAEEGALDSSDNTKRRPRSLQIYPDEFAVRETRRLSDQSILINKQLNRRSAPVSLFSFTSSPDDGSRDKARPIEEVLQRLLASHDGESHRPISKNQVADALKALSGEGIVDSRKLADEAYKRLAGDVVPASGEAKIPLCDVSLIKGRASLPSQIARRHRSLSASDLENSPGGTTKLTRSGAQRKRHSIAAEPFSTLESRRQSLRELTSEARRGSAESASATVRDRRRHSWADPRQLSDGSARKLADSSPLESSRNSPALLAGRPPRQPNVSSQPEAVPLASSREGSTQVAPTPTVALAKQSSTTPRTPPYRPSTAGVNSTAPPKSIENPKTRARARTTSLDANLDSTIERRDHVRNFSVPLPTTAAAAAPPPGPSGRKMVEPKLAPVIQIPRELTGEGPKGGRRKSWWKRIVPGKGKAKGKGDTGTTNEVVKGRKSIDVVEASTLGSEAQHHQGMFQGMDEDGKWVLGR